MQDEKLVAMANQIAGFFGAYAAPEAAAGVRKHLLAFWTPAMLAGLAARVARDPAGIDVLVIAAIQGGKGALPSMVEGGGPLVRAED